MAARGCGHRSAGGLYAECLLSPFGEPIEHFLVDPPIPIDQDAFGITPRGVRLIQRDGVYHIMDWVGSQYYPNVLDMVEEIRRMGLSRRLNPKLDFSKLTLQSRIILLHSRAYIKNFKEYKSDSVCNRQIPDPDHTANKGMCMKLWWEDVEGGERQSSLYPDDDRRVRRDMPSFSYNAMRRPENVVPDYRLAIFASFPIHRIAVVNDPAGGKHKDAIKKAEESKIEVALVDE